MSDILDKIVAVKREEIAAAQKRKPLEAVRADAHSRVLTRDFEGALRAKIANWEEVARYLVSTTYAEILAAGGEPRALAFIEEIMAYPDVPASFRKLRFEDRPTPVLTVEYLVGGKALSVFTTIATLGTPQDITLQEVRIECFFPADERSDALFKSLAAKR